MSVYIKGMEMPKSCFECKLLDYTDTFKCRVRYESLAKEHGITISRPDWCPLIPVPPHGDLIDRDALLTDTKNLHVDVLADWVYVKISTIEDAPTIIPAEDLDNG